jgi:hypothetical protein
MELVNVEKESKGICLRRAKGTTFVQFGINEIDILVFWAKYETATIASNSLKKKIQRIRIK